MQSIGFFNSINDEHGLCRSLEIDKPIKCTSKTVNFFLNYKSFLFGILFEFAGFLLGDKILPIKNPFMDNVEISQRTAYPTSVNIRMSESLSYSANRFLGGRLGPNPKNGPVLFANFFDKGKCFFQKLLNFFEIENLYVAFYSGN